MYGREVGVFLFFLRVKKRQRRWRESQRKTQDVRWWMQTLITCHRLFMISLAGCCLLKSFSSFLPSIFNNFCLFGYPYMQVIIHLQTHGYSWRPFLECVTVTNFQQQRKVLCRSVCWSAAKSLMGSWGKSGCIPEEFLKIFYSPEVSMI